MTSPFLVIIDGPMGSGKTTTTKLLNQMLPNSARIALPDIKRLVPNYKETEGTLSIVREVMKVMVDKYLEFGVSVVVECISKSEGVGAFKTIAKNRNATFRAYRLTAPKDKRWSRVLERTREMMDVSELPLEKIAELEGYFEPNHQFYVDNPIPNAELIDTDQLSAAEVTEIIIGKLK